MKAFKLSILFLFLLGASAGNLAWADRGGHGHAHVGVYIGVPLFWPWYYSPPPYYGPVYGPVYSPYYSETIITPAPVYIERAPAPSSNVWHYCSNPDGYYPYVKECPGGWQRVTPN